MAVTHPSAPATKKTGALSAILQSILKQLGSLAPGKTEAQSVGAVPLARLLSEIHKAASAGFHVTSISYSGNIATLKGVYNEGVGLPFGIGVGQLNIFGINQGPATVKFNLKTGKPIAGTGKVKPTTTTASIGSDIGAGIGAAGTNLASGLVSGATGFLSGLEPAIGNYFRKNVWVVLLFAVAVIILLGAGLKMFDGGHMPIPVPV